MKSRSEARRRGIQVAARVAAVAGILGACAGLGRAEPPKPRVIEAKDQDASAPVDRAGVKNLLELKGMAADCGCSPCWGPPAPPPMRARTSRRARRAVAS